MDLLFLKSNRFWAMVIGCLALVAQGNFTQEAWLKGLSALVAGFITIRTVDRTAEFIGGVVEE